MAFKKSRDNDIISQREIMNHILVLANLLVNYFMHDDYAREVCLAFFLGWMKVLSRCGEEKTAELSLRAMPRCEAAPVSFRFFFLARL